MFFQTERVENSGESQTVLSAEGARCISAESLRRKDRAHFAARVTGAGCGLCVFFGVIGPCVTGSFFIF